MIPRLHFANLPTPVEPLPRLTAALQGPRLLVKRDDLTGLALGGNKTRKLEFLVAEAQAMGADTLVTTGAVQSNHCRQTAAAAARFGLKCVLLLVGSPPPTPSANLLLDRLLGASLLWTEKSRRDADLQKTVNDIAARGGKPYLVPYGGSSPTGVLAYANAMQEFIAQSIPVDWIICASSSGGTQAGLILGKILHGFRGRILGISIDEPQIALQSRVADLAARAGRLLGHEMYIHPREVLVNSEYAAPGYGILTAAELQAISLFASTEGLLLDPVYTGRLGAGLIDLINRGFFRREETALFWHTGGQPALFAEDYLKDLGEMSSRSHGST
jgi:D-cysteine desulfhydrase family pyridoxal phosphate-dependent enzyme